MPLISTTRTSPPKILWRQDEVSFTQWHGEGCRTGAFTERTLGTRRRHACRSTNTRTSETTVLGPSLPIFSLTLEKVFSKAVSSTHLTSRL